ncbi:hypothetical protein HOR97_gp34 [Agrobacterium phage Atu_ph03]|uniref:Internal virion protein n=1 Tax=Agrobacterium phage Atu_ph03 TaxID=2024262 RepID=A0A2L0UZ22_9CAUD|nr:hypothetical protein HOR97_gp34 [Agrobacterium phage Atu_ph03]AUZ94786.1 hypothetical protein [Agrobacterium phage Atu_ph03]
MAFGAQQMNGAFSALSTLTSFITASKQAKQDRLWQEYNNKLAKIQNGQNQNIITVNDLMRRDRKHTQLEQIQKSETATLASAEAAAAAAGATGNSVNAVLRDISSNAANAVAAIERDDDLQDAQSINQRFQSDLGLELQLDRRVISGPSTASLLLGLGEGLVKGTAKR